MLSTDQVRSLIGGTAVDESGDRIGKIGMVYLDDQSGNPEWVTVNTGFFGSNESFVPLAQASAEGDTLRLPYSKDKVKDAPNVDAEGHLDVDQEQELYRYYGLDYDSTSSDVGTSVGTVNAGETVTGTETTAGTMAGAATGMAATDRVDASDRIYADKTELVSDVRDDTDAGTISGRGDVEGTSRDTVGRDTSGPTTDDAMTRSEERLHVGTEKREAGKARLRKYVVTEDETVTVPVSREEVRIEREPITDENRDEALSGPDISEEEHEVVLTEERPVVEKETVPVERVRLDTETVTDEQQVTEEVRKEKIETEGVDDTRRDRR